jgi:hypothetical protein
MAALRIRRFRTDRRLFFHNPLVAGCVVTGTIAKVALLAGRVSLQYHHEEFSNAQENYYTEGDRIVRSKPTVSSDIGASQS